MVIKNNETTYLERYGISLNDRWDTFSLNEQISAIERVQEFIKADPSTFYSFKEDVILRIVLGYRNAAFLESIIENAPQTARVIVWEPDEALFLAGCVEEDISEIIMDEKYNIIFGSYDMSIVEKTIDDNLFVYNVYHFFIFGFGEYMDAENKYVKKMVSIIEDKGRKIVFENNMLKKYGKMPYHNYLFAIHSFSNNSTIDQLTDRITSRDIPIIIVSAGPSLMRNAATLKKAKNKSIIIAVTHALKTLYREGVYPDMVAVTDPADTDFMDCDTNRDAMLLCSAYASHKDQMVYDGQIIYYGFTSYEGLFTTDRVRCGINPELDTGSVSTDIFSLFIEAGFHHFILVGQDLAYDEEGHTHTDNFKDDTGIIIDTEGIDGSYVKTRYDWNIFRRYFEERIASEPGIQVIDATEGGALIHGTIIMPLEAAISEYCYNVYPVGEWIKNLEKGSKDEKEEIESWFDNNIYRCVKVGKNIREAIKINESIRHIWSSPELWNDEISASCKRYDVLYNYIMESGDGELLRLYCRTEIQKYLEDALTIEGDENIEKRMNFEFELFSALERGDTELVYYMKELREAM